MSGRQLGASLVRLARPSPVAANAAQVLLGAYVASGREAIVRWPVVSAAVAMALLTATVNVVNDLRDIEADRLNRPTRPLVTGVVTARVGAFAAGAAAVIAVALVVGELVRTLILIAIMVLSVSYSFGVKKLPLAANAYVAGLAGTPLIYGAYVSGGGISEALVGAVVLSTFMFSYEVLKTLRDTHGDREAGFDTVATRYGLRMTVATYRMAVGAFTLSAVLPLVLTTAGLPYVVLMGCGAVLPSIIIASRMTPEPSPATVRAALHVLVICWLPGLLSLGDMG